LYFRNTSELNWDMFTVTFNTEIFCWIDSLCNQWHFRIKTSIIFYNNLLKLQFHIASNPPSYNFQTHLPNSQLVSCHTPFKNLLCHFTVYELDNNHIIWHSKSIIKNWEVDSFEILLFSSLHPSSLINIYCFTRRCDKHKAERIYPDFLDLTS
jgi:hypothetical protein